jgi:hypothetical protein
MNLKSSVTKKGNVVTQILTFVGGFKKTVHGVKTDTIVQSEFTHFETEDGRMIMVNDKNVLLIEIFKES